MTDSDKIATLYANVAQMLKQSNQLKAQNTQLQAKLQAEKAISVQLFDKIKALEQQLTLLTISKSTIEVSGTPKNAKARINAMIKDIDRAITILNR